MASDTVCRTVRQYNKNPISVEDMKKLQEIAEDYRKVKLYVYQRYGGIGSLSKLYPGYTVQNEMTDSGLRAELGLPSVYFYLAMFDALGDIKGQWTRTKTKLLRLIGQNDNLSGDEKHYLRFLLKVNNAFTAVLNQEDIVLPKEMQGKYLELAAKIDAEKMHRYLCRQVRKYHVSNLVQGKTGQAESCTGFAISERAYRYGDEGGRKKRPDGQGKSADRCYGIYISTKENRKRIFVPLTDRNQYKSQLYIRLFPQEARIEISATIDVSVRSHEDYTNQTGLAMGVFTMLTTHEGHVYGEKLGEYQREYADWVREQTGNYNRNKTHNPGRKKYQAKKKRYEERLHSYINHELNRFLQTEKPQQLYIVKLPGAQSGGVNRKINHSVSMWQRGYIRKRLEQKCKEQSVELVEVLGKGISTECSCCGAGGNRKDGMFSCDACGYTVEEKINTAKNVLKRGMEGKVIV